MRLTQFILFIAFFASAHLLPAAENRATVSAILVIASNERGPADPHLASYEANLKRTLRFESFRYVGESSAAVTAAGKAALTLPNNNRLELEGQGGGRVKVSNGSTSAVIPSGQTLIFAGRPAGERGEIFAVIVSVN